MSEKLTAWERLIGPDSTPAESRGAVMSGLVGAVIAVVLAVTRVGDISLLGAAVLGVMALDIVGGVWANATTTTRRWYHRPGIGSASSVRFALLHVHPFLVAWAVPGFDWTIATVLYLGMLVAYLVVEVTPSYLKSPTAAVTALVVFTLVLMLDPDLAGVEWFVPAYLLKLLTGHAVPAEPTPQHTG